jgi:hypothetical protein
MNKSKFGLIPIYLRYCNNAQVVKLVYTLALGAGPFGGGGSSPLLGTLYDTFRLAIAALDKKVLVCYI